MWHLCPQAFSIHGKYPAVFFSLLTSSHQIATSSRPIVILYVMTEGEISDCPMLPETNIAPARKTSQKETD